MTLTRGIHEAFQFARVPVKEDVGHVLGERGNLSLKDWGKRKVNSERRTKTGGRRAAIGGSRRDMARSIAQANPAPAPLLSQRSNYPAPFVTFLFPTVVAQPFVTRILGKLAIKQMAETGVSPLCFRRLSLLTVTWRIDFVVTGGGLWWLWA